VRALRERMQHALGPRQLVGSSPVLERVRTQILQVAASDATVLVTGESGTGKQWAASEVHARSARAGAPFGVVNCAALVESEFEPELFGCRQGATPAATHDRDGRIAQAEGGTLVLDEVGALQPASQARLLRFLETGEFQTLG
jgi:DNA-binding NtrC family response regulator